MCKSHHEIIHHDNLESEAKYIMQHFYIKANNTFLQHIKWI